MSCQDSMDTEDSIPRPEYEGIVIDDDDYWIAKTKTVISAIKSEMQQQPTVSNSSTAPACCSNQNQSNLGKDIDKAMEEVYEDDEISYDEADENFEEDDVDEELRKTIDNLVSRRTTTVQRSDDPLKITDRSKSAISAAPSTSTAAEVVQANARNNKLVVVTLINENGKVVVPLAQRPSKPIVSTTAVTHSPAETSPGKRISSMDEIKSQLSTPKEELSRSSTPSARGTREFMALQKSFTESKVLSEFVNEKDRSRKSRKLPLKSEDSTTGNDGEREKFRICRGRSKSCTRTSVRPITVLNNSAPQKWPSDEKLNSKRENMRSQNTDFVQKHMKFLNRVNHEQTGDDPMSDASDGDRSLNESNKTVGLVEIKDNCWQPPPKRGADSFCWKCRKCADLIACSKCPRSYHYKCIKISNTTRLDKTWSCPECVSLDSCINRPKKSKKEPLSVDLLNQLLLFALKRMKQIKGHEQFLDVPDERQIPLYAQYVVNPVTLNSIQEKIEKKAFRCTEEFVLETKWIQHNVSIAYAAYSSKIGLIAKTLLKVCRQEAAEIETCSECYLNANTRKDWFVDVCFKPHILLWAKLKGFPYWPAKGMGLGPNSLVNVRFFGDHDRAFVPVKDCFLYSEKDPNPHSGKRTFRSGIADCIKEVDVHIQKIRAKVGSFNFAPPKSQYDPSNEMAQLEEMMPGVTEYVQRQQALQKPPLTYKIVKTAGNNLSIIKKPDSGADSDHSSLGAEKHRTSTRTSTEISKPSPLSESKKAKESQSIPQSTSQKTNIDNKTILNKNMSLNYEVVAKPTNKDESNSSKINSVILKRKSDILLVPPNAKKWKNSEDSPVKVYTNRTSSSPKLNEKLEESKEAMEVVPAKRTRSGDKIPPAQGTPGGHGLVYRFTQVEAQKGLPHQQINPIQQQKPQQQLQQISDVATTTAINNETDTPCSSMAKLVQNRQGVTIKKISKKSSGILTYFATDDNAQKSASDDKTNSFPERYSQLSSQQPKIISTPEPTLKLAESTPEPAPSPPKPASFLSTPKLNPSYLSSTSPSPITEKTKKSKGLIPFEDIKLERPEDEELIPTKSAPSTSRAIDPLATSSNSSTRQQSFESPSNGNSKTPIAGVNPPSPPINPDLVKKETISDDESSSNSTPSQENSSPAIVSNQPSKKSIELPRLVGETMIQRIVVRSLESLTMQPPVLKNVPTYYFTSVPSSGTSSTPPLTTPAQPKKTNPRARKSFPNKGPNAATVMLPADVKRSLTKNSMVYIPVDSQNNAVPIQPLTAVSKPVNNNPTTVRVTCTTTIPSSNTTQSSFNPVTLPTSIPIPLPEPPGQPILPVPTAQPALSPVSVASSAASPSPSASLVSPISTTLPAPTAVSAALTNTTNPVSSMVTAVTSSVAYRPSYVSTLKTLSPLQLTVPVTSTVDSEETNEGSNEGEGHILSGIVTPSLAGAITDTIVRGPPKLAPRPNGALRSDGNFGFNSDAGPVCRTLVESAHKITDFFISVMQDTVNDLANVDIVQAKVVELQMELETKVASYEKRLYELKQNTDTMLCEMKKSMETERIRLVSETRKQCEIERIHAVEQTKKKQWCSNCGREANCYCCWNTAYCDTNCQGMDWMRHKPNCCQVNPHLNPELQGPGILFSAPNIISTCATNTTPTNPTISCTTPGFMPIQPIHLFRACQPTPPPPPQPPSSSTPLQSTTTITSIQKRSGSPPNVNTTCAPSTFDMAYKSKEVLRLPPSTYLRALTPTMRLATPPVHRFNIPLPIATAPTTGGPPFTLVHREGNWELMGSKKSSAAASASAASFQPTTRLITAVTATLPPDSRPLGPVMVRPNLM